MKPQNKPVSADTNELNNHLNSVAENLTSSIRSTPEELLDLINNLHTVDENTFSLKKTSYNDFLKAITKIRNDCHDTIPINILKLVAGYIASPLTYILNNFIKSNSFSVDWKIARISAIPTTPGDFRPILILPVLSKVFERVVLNQLTDHINQMRILKESQHGFRKYHSTISCLLKFRDDILKTMTKREVTISVFADYSKAFDTRSFKRLLERLNSLHFSKSF